MNHDIISKQLPNAKMSGVKIDENEITVNINFCIKLLVWLDDGTVEEARTLYFLIEKSGILDKEMKFH